MVLHTLAMLALASGAPGGQRLPGQGLSADGTKFFKSVIPTPTGNNGYEDYVEAAAMLKSPEHQAFELWKSYWQRSERGTREVRDSLDAEEKGASEVVPEPPRPAGLTLQATPFEVRQAYVKRFGTVFEGVKRGNAKPVFQPRESIDFETLFPELGSFRLLSRLGQDIAMAEFAAGNPAKATETLLEALQFSENIAEGTIISELVSIANRSVIFSALDYGLGRFSLPDAQQIVKATQALLAQGPRAIKTLESEFKYVSAGIDKFMAEPKKDVLDSDEENEDNLFIRLGALGEADRKRVATEAKAHMETKRRGLAALLRQPESRWSTYQESEIPVAPGQEETIGGLAARLANEMTPFVGSYLEVAVRSRTQLRILRLIGRVLVYKWTFDKLPSELSQAAPADEVRDPATEGDFKYEVNGKNFRVYSSGFGRTGAIDLVYRRPAPPFDRDRDPNEPPGL